jgi:hypothetical protein
MSIEAGLGWVTGLLVLALIGLCIVGTVENNKFWDECHAKGGYVFQPRGGSICLDRRQVIGEK